MSTAGATEDTQPRRPVLLRETERDCHANQFDDATLERVVRRSEELAQLAPEDPELVPPLEPQTVHADPRGLRRRDREDHAEYRAHVAEASIGPAKAKDCVAAGFLQDGTNWQAMANSTGLFAYHRATGLNFSVTVRSTDGTGSGYVERDENDVARFDGAASSAIAVEKAAASRQAKAIEPGKYTVILEPDRRGRAAAAPDLRHGRPLRRRRPELALQGRWRQQAGREAGGRGGDDLVRPGPPRHTDIALG